MIRDRKDFKGRDNQLYMDRFRKIHVVLLFLAALSVRPIIVSVSSQNQNLDYEIVCTRVVVHYSRFYSLALTEPIIKGLDQDDLAEYLNQLYDGTSNKNDNFICFPKEKELKNLEEHFNSKLEDKFTIEIEYKEHSRLYLRCAEGRHVILLKPKNQDFSFISFEYDGIHLDTILTKEDETELKDLVESPDFSRIFPNFKNAQDDLLSSIEEEIGDYILGVLFRDEFDFDTSSPEKNFWGGKQGYFTICFEFEQPREEDIQDLKESVFVKSAYPVYLERPSSENIEQISFRIDNYYYYGYVKSENDLRRFSNPKADSYSHIFVALALHISTLLDWEDEDIEFLERLENLNTPKLSLNEKEFVRLTRLKSNLVVLRKTLPTILLKANTTISGMSTLEKSKISQIDSIDRKIEILYATYVNKRMLSLAFCAIIITLGFSLISIFLSLASLRYSRTPKSLRMGIWRLMRYRYLLKIKYWLRDVRSRYFRRM